jgi:hypothetical protein
MALWEHVGEDVRDDAIGLFQSQTDGDGIGQGAGLLAKGAIGENGGTKGGVEDRGDAGGDQGETVVGVHEYV